MEISLLERQQNIDEEIASLLQKLENLRGLRRSVQIELENSCKHTNRVRVCDEGDDRAYYVCEYCGCRLI